MSTLPAGSTFCDSAGRPPPPPGGRRRQCSSASITTEIDQGFKSNKLIGFYVFAVFTIAYAIEEFTRSVFFAASRWTHRLEIDLSGLLRGDAEQRWCSQEVAVKDILDTDEVRELEGWSGRS